MNMPDLTLVDDIFPLYDWPAHECTPCNVYIVVDLDGGLHAEYIYNHELQHVNYKYVRVPCDLSKDQYEEIISEYREEFLELLDDNCSDKAAQLLSEEIHRAYAAEYLMITDRDNSFFESMHHIDLSDCKSFDALFDLVTENLCTTHCWLDPNLCDKDSLLKAVASFLAHKHRYHYCCDFDAESVSEIEKQLLEKYED
jgi:hypothetical protein